MIIAMSGLDGAGKSTQIAQLTEHLKDRRIFPRVIWARGGYTPLFEILKKLIRVVARKKIPPPGHTKERERHLSKSWVQKMWLNIAIIDLILLWGIYVRLMSKLGFFIICDRYINDTLLDFKRNFPDSAFEESWTWGLLKFITPKPDHAFVMWVPVETSLERSKEKGEPFPDSKETLEWRLNSYTSENIFPSSDSVRLDGRLSIEVIAKKIYEEIRLNNNLDRSR